MKIALNSIMVDDQAKALAFYTDVLGFTTKLVTYQPATPTPT